MREKSKDHKLSPGDCEVNMITKISDTRYYKVLTSDTSQGLHCLISKCRIISSSESAEKKINLHNSLLHCYPNKISV